MHILVLNPGSSSIKFAMYADGWAELRVLYAGELNDISEASAADRKSTRLNSSH